MVGSFHTFANSAPLACCEVRGQFGAPGMRQVLTSTRVLGTRLA